MKIQLIRWCRQCECLLPRRCLACIKHPERKPRVVELYGMPPILYRNSCGCVGFKCQRVGCLQIAYFHPRADGTLGKKNRFCSPACVRADTAAAKVAKRVTTPCADGCGRLVSRPASDMKAKHSYFSQFCHYRHRVQMKATARRANVSLDVQAKVCYGKACRGEITDHKRLPNNVLACVRCNGRSKEASMRVESTLARA